MQNAAARAAHALPDIPCDAEGPVFREPWEAQAFAMALTLHEETVTDHRFGRFMSHNLADYHVPVNADVHAIDVIFVEEKDDEINPLGVKGVGEIGIVGTAAAVANAVYHATGKRVRDLPITLDKLMRDQG